MPVAQQRSSRRNWQANILGLEVVESIRSQIDMRKIEALIENGLIVGERAEAVAQLEEVNSRVHSLILGYER